MAIHPFTSKGLWFYLLILIVTLVALWLNVTQGRVVSIVFTSLAGALLLGAFLFLVNLAPETKKLLVTTMAKIRKRI